MVEIPGKSGHLTPNEAKAYLHRSLTPEERWKIDLHLSSCPACRRRVRLDTVEEQAVAFLEADLQFALQEEDPHLAYEEMEDYLENRADAIAREIVEGHIDLCALCAAELRELQEFRLLVMAETASIQDVEESVTLLDTTGLVQITGGRAHLAGMRSLSRAPLRRAGELVREGLVRPLPSLQNRLDILRRATTLTLVRAHRQEPPIPLAPAYTMIRSSSPVFRWTTVPDADAYHVVIASLDKQGMRALLWQGPSETENSLPLPANLSLEPGRAYLWYIRARVGQEERPSPFAWFALLTPAALRQVEQEERRMEPSALALACLYERYGLYQEAFVQVERLLALNPKHPQVQKMHQRLRALLHPVLPSH
jgi:hypothetical protein